MLLHKKDNSVNFTKQRRLSCTKYLGLCCERSSQCSKLEPCQSLCPDCWYTSVFLSELTLSRSAFRRTVAEEKNCGLGLRKKNNCYFEKFVPSKTAIFQFKRNAEEFGEINQ